jgi:hypothetical protein
MDAELMGEKKVNMQELAQKVDELLNILKTVSGDLAEVSKSLKATTAKTAPSSSSAPSGPPVAQLAGQATLSAASSASTQKTYDVTSVKKAFSSDLAGMLLFEETGKFVIVKPRRFLGSDNFAKIASVVRELGGEYVSAGRNSHFKIAKS